MTLEEALRHFDQGDVATTTEAITDLLASSDRLTRCEGLILRGRLHIRRAKGVDALSDLIAAAKIYPGRDVEKESKLLPLFARAYRILGNYPVAAQLLIRAIEIAPSDFEKSRALLGLALARQQPDNPLRDLEVSASLAAEAYDGFKDHGSFRLAAIEAACYALVSDPESDVDEAKAWFRKLDAWPANGGFVAANRLWLKGLWHRLFQEHRAAINSFRVAAGTYSALGYPDHEGMALLEWGISAATVGDFDCLIECAAATFRCMRAIGHGTEQVASLAAFKEAILGQNLTAALGTQFRDGHQKMISRPGQ